MNSGNIRLDGLHAVIAAWLNAFQRIQAHSERKLLFSQVRIRMAGFPLTDSDEVCPTTIDHDQRYLCQ